MKTFILRLHGATASEDIADVTSFVGNDDSGCFGLLADHARFMTILSIGIAKYRISQDCWKYLAVPSAVIYFNHNILTLCTHRYLLDDDYMRINQTLQQQLLAEDAKLRRFTQSIHHMEKEVFKQLSEMGKKDRV